METSSFDFLTGRTDVHLESYGKFLLAPESLEQFKSMQKKAKKDANIDLRLVSSFRSFERQQIIWNGKASGERKILDDNENTIEPSELSESQLVHAILRFSALPGASRHHWGTDIDVFDANVKKKEEVKLTVNESLKEFEKLNVWLNENMNDYGFYRPYSQDRGGVSQEPWHLSYYPLSSEYFRHYSLDVFKENIQRSQIKLKSTVLSDLNDIYEKYVLNIEKQ